MEERAIHQLEGSSALTAQRFGQSERGNAGRPNPTFQIKSANTGTTPYPKYRPQQQQGRRGKRRRRRGVALTNLAGEGALLRRGCCHRSYVTKKNNIAQNIHLIRVSLSATHGTPEEFYLLTRSD